MAPPKHSLQLGEAPFGEEIDWEPRRLVMPGPWAGHLPFAFWLVKAARPRLLVELGTHSGNSFSAFCQSIEATRAPTRAFAVDTWKGDEHAGHYGEEIFTDLKAFIEGQYGGFATLLRLTFDEAVSHFMPQSVDVLHIDGMHSYEAVKHDYLTWLDMLSDRAVVLFHDTQVRERGFGVWKLWQELSAEHPSFEFTHSNGLGVLGVGKNLPPEVMAFFESARDEKAAWNTRALFAARGRPFELATQIMALRQENARLEGYHHHLEAELAAVKGHLEGTQALLAGAQEQLAGAQEEQQRQAAEARGRIEEERRQQGALERAVAEGKAEAERLTQAIAERDAILAETRRQRAELTRMVEDLHRSTSWRVTRPLRVTGRLVKRYLADRRPRLAAAPAEIAQPASAQPARAEAPPLHNAALRDATRSMMMSRLDAFLNSGTTLRLPRAREPDVSIILVLYNQAEMTYSCLASIRECLEHSPVSVETIILDNDSRDKTHALLDRIEGAEIIKNDSNLHFLRGVNAAAARATGRHILLLNNDAQLTPGALEAAVRTLDEDSTVGAVGGRIILPDGLLQEAGSIIWADGSCLGYGRGRRPDDAEFMFQRDVDYCSGAFLLTPRALFERMGRLDEAYVPAYYEETDYCVRVWKENLRVVYNPKVVIHHFEFASSGKVGDALQLQERNLQTFRDRHAEWLARQQPPHTDNILRARQHRSARPRLLFIEDQVPKSWLGSGFPRAAEILRELHAQGVQVTLYPTAGQPESWPEVWKALPLEIEIVLPHAEGVELRDFLARRRDSFDGVFVTRPHNMERLRKLLDREPGLLGAAKLIYDAEALFAKREILKKALEGAPLSPAAQRKLVQEELALARDCDLVLSVSEAERGVMTESGIRNVRVLGHMVETDPTSSPFDTRTDILFLGAIHADDSPNADSVRWFAREVLPELRALLGDEDVRLKVAGLVRAPSIQAMDGDSLQLIGPVGALKPVFEKARLVVAPTRFAAGIPHKAHQAAAFGVPMVTTELIASQLGWTSGEELLASSEAGAFARHCHAAYTSAELWSGLRDKALIRVAKDCSAASFAATLLEITHLIGEARKP